MWGEIAQLVINGLVAGTVLAVPAIGFTAIYAVLRFPNFTVASHATIGAFAGYVVNTAFGWRAGAAVLVAFLVAGAAGVVNDHVVLRPLRPAGALTTAIGAVALTIVLENVVRFVFGNDLRGYDLPIRRDWQWGPLRIGPQQVQNLVIAVVAMTAVFVFLASTRTGNGFGNRPVPRYAWVRNPEGLTIDISKSPRQTASARIGEPVDMRSRGLKFSPEPLPTEMHMSRGP